MKNRKSYRNSFLLSCLLIIIILCILASVNEFRFSSLMKLGRCALDNISSQSKDSMEDSMSTNSSSTGQIRILIGILTLPDHYQKRHLLRMIYNTQSPPNAQVDLKFVFCNLTKEDQKVLVALEIMRHDDIIILNCQENMNNGKTYTYFSSLPEILNSTDKSYPPYNYVMKADDDIYFRLDKLVESLRTLPTDDLYYGFVIPCSSMDPFKHYMAGMGYLVSWDIVEWIQESDIPKNHLNGPEDRTFGEWLHAGKKGQNRYNAKWSMYDYPVPNKACTHELWPDTIAVHRLKDQEKWINTLSYFNVTANLKPSKLYHIP